MFACPTCGAKTKVVVTVGGENCIRKRQCKRCRKIFLTQESIVEMKDSRPVRLSFKLSTNIPEKYHAICIQESDPDSQVEVDVSMIVEKATIGYSFFPVYVTQSRQVLTGGDFLKLVGESEIECFRRSLLHIKRYFPLWQEIQEQKMAVLGKH